MHRDDVGKELLDRARRIETRLMRLATHMGCDPTSDKRRVTADSRDPYAVTVSGLDVSLGDLLLYCKNEGISGTLNITFNNRLVCVFTPWKYNGQ